MANVVRPPGGPEAPDTPKTKERKSQRGQQVEREEKSATVTIRIEQKKRKAMEEAMTREGYTKFSDWARYHLIHASTVKDVFDDRIQLDRARATLNAFLGYIERNPDRLSVDHLKSLAEDIHTEVAEVIDAMLRRVWL